MHLFLSYCGITVLSSLPKNQTSQQIPWSLQLGLIGRLLLLIKFKIQNLLLCRTFKCYFQYLNYSTYFDPNLLHSSINCITLADRPNLKWTRIWQQQFSIVNFLSIQLRLEAMVNFSDVSQWPKLMSVTQYMCEHECGLSSWLIHSCCTLHYTHTRLSIRQNWNEQ